MFNKLKKKRVVIVLGILFSLIIIITSSLVFSPFIKFESSLQSYYDNEVQTFGYPPVGWGFITERSPYQVIRCNFDLKNPEVSILYTNKSQTYFTVEFWKMNRDNILVPSWNIKSTKYEGSSDVSKTDFDSLVSLIKSDCNQFKQSYPSDSNPRKGDDKTDVYWLYSKPDPEPTDSSKIQDQITHLKAEIAYNQALIRVSTITLNDAKADKYLREENGIKLTKEVTIAKIQSDIDGFNKKIIDIQKQIDDLNISIKRTK